MVKVYLVKRFRRKRKRNGQREWVWSLRWQDATGWRYESTGTADKVQAAVLLGAKRDELNAPPEAIAKPTAKASWQECRDAFERAMRADNLRRSYVNDSLLVWDKFQGMFPNLAFPADVTHDIANDFKRQRAEAKVSPWSIKGDLATLRAIFGKWLCRECGLLQSNPFANIRPPKCDDPEVRIVTATESAALFAWLGERWNQWRLPLVYLQVAALLGWRATEIASIRAEDLLGDGYVLANSKTCKTRRDKYGWLPAQLYAELQGCVANGWAFGKFADELERRLIVLKRRPNHAAMVKEFSPKRLVGWLQDELKRFHKEQGETAAKEQRPIPATFTLHDFRRTAITGLQMSGVSEKDCSLLVGCSPEVIRKHYERLDGMAIAKRSIERRLATASGDAKSADAQLLARILARAEFSPLDDVTKSPQTATA